MPDQNSDHWLVRKSTIRLLWAVSLAFLAGLVLIDFYVPHHPEFDIDGVVGFSAWFGFASCVVLVFLAKALGLILKRPDTYYDN